MYKKHNIKDKIENQVNVEKEYVFSLFIFCFRWSYDKFSVTFMINEKVTENVKWVRLDDIKSKRII